MTGPTDPALRWQPGEALDYAVSQYHDNGYWSDHNRTHTDPDHIVDCTDEVCVAIRVDRLAAAEAAPLDVAARNLIDYWEMEGEVLPHQVDALRAALRFPDTETAGEIK